MLIPTPATVLVPSDINDLTTDGINNGEYLLKSGGVIVGGDPSGTIPSGTVFPVSPTLGDLFLFTPFNSVYQYSGSTWVNLRSFSAFTMYVDPSLGSDSFGKGTSTGSDAFATYPFALSQLPQDYGGDITIKLAAGSTYRLPQTIPARNTNGYFTYTDGDVTEKTSGTTTGYFRVDQTPAGGGQVQTTGSSTTVNLIGGGTTTNLCVGAVVTANSLKRYVTAIGSSTQFTVDTAVDWSAGYSWTYNNVGTIVDSSASWSDDQYNNDFLLWSTNLAITSPFQWTPTAVASMFPIKDTFASSKRLQLGAGVQGFGTGLFPYKVYGLNSTIEYNLVNINVYLTGMIFRCVKFSYASSGTINFRNSSIFFFGCDFVQGRQLTFYNCSVNLDGCIYRSPEAFFTPFAFIGAGGVAINGDNITTNVRIYRTLFSPLTSSWLGISLVEASCALSYCVIDCNVNSATYFLQAANLSYFQFVGTCVIRRVSGTTTAARAQSSSYLLSISTGLLDVGFTAQSSVVAAQMSYAT